jgi:hypothetical protein
MDGRKVVYKDADAYLMNLTYYGIANTITQLCDNYFLYLRLVAMEKPHVCVRCDAKSGSSPHQPLSHRHFAECG